MDVRPILFMDSGVGGLPYCRDFLKNNPLEEICYLADRYNFPYGQRDKNELTSILIELIKKMLQVCDPKIIVLACNTATVSSLDALRSHFVNIPFVGTVPAIKPALNASKNGKVGILGTARTIDDPYIKKLTQDNAAQEKNNCGITAIAAPDLVEFVELYFDRASEEEKTDIVKKYINIFRDEGVDTLVLGCTHFLYLLEEFRREASPDITIYDSLDGITKRIEFLLNENNNAMRSSAESAPFHKLIITGNKAADTVWENRAYSLGFKLSLLKDL